MTFRIMALSIKSLYVAFSISDTQHSNYAQCHCADCRILFIIKLNVIMLSVVMLNVVMPSVVAPLLLS